MRLHALARHRSLMAPPCMGVQGGASPCSPESLDGRTFLAPGTFATAHKSAELPSGSPTPARPGARAGHAPRRKLASIMTVTVQTPPDDRERGRWLSIKVAASELSVSERTVSRWIARGKLRRRHREDGHVEVWIPQAEPDMWDDSGQDSRPDSDGHERSLQLLERVDAVLTRQQLPLLERIDSLAERVESVARENGQLVEKNAVLARELDAVRTELVAVRTVSTRAVRRWAVAAAALLAVIAALVGVTLVVGSVAAARGV